MKLDAHKLWSESGLMKAPLTSVPSGAGAGASGLMTTLRERVEDQRSPRAIPRTHARGPARSMRRTCGPTPHDPGIQGKQET